MSTLEHIPRHVALIPDGNRRWAKAHGLLPHEGHREGAKRFKDQIEALHDEGVEFATFWVSSEDNIVKRTPEEVAFLIMLIKKAGKDNETLEIAKKIQYRIRWIGKWRELLKDKEVEEIIDGWENETAHHTKGQMTFLFCYNGKTEMLEAIKSLEKTGNSNPTHETVKNALWTRDLPDVDLVIRTGGEPHWSAGFMMWLTSDSQLYFTDALWPDFKKEELTKALIDYNGRTRRFGK